MRPREPFQKAVDHAIAQAVGRPSSGLPATPSEAEGLQTPHPACGPASPADPLTRPAATVGEAEGPQTPHPAYGHPLPARGARGWAVAADRSPGPPNTPARPKGPRPLTRPTATLSPHAGRGAEMSPQTDRPSLFSVPI